MELLILLFLVGLASSADITDPAQCTEFPCLIFNDDFDFFDHEAWEHEVTMAGGGNQEFEVYVNNRSISYIRDGIFYIKPGMVADWKDEDALYNGTIDLWGMNGKNDVCTGNFNVGCKRTGSSQEILNPVMSARLRTLGVFSFRYGSIEVRAKLPSGAWLWPAIWLLPDSWPYGLWPASGEIDILESRGNEIYGDMSNDFAGSTLHWGPYADLNRYYLTHVDYTVENGTFADDFHTWNVEWNDDHIRYTVDGEEVMYIDPVTSFWEFGNFSQEFDGIHNPWQTGGKMAPFDQKFYIIMNLAVGGSQGYFPDDVEPSDPPKPWRNDSPSPMKDFWEDFDSWWPTWTHGEDTVSELAALQVDYIRVYKMSAEEISK